METAVIGVDLGTSACKAVAFDMQGHALARSRRAYATSFSSDGAAVQEASYWISAAIEAIAEVVARVDVPLIGIGLSGQIGTHVLVGSACDPLHPAVTWQDGRSALASEAVWSAIDRREFASALNTWLPDGGAWPLPRMHWLRMEFPDAFARASHLAQPKDVLVHALTGRLASDASSWRGIVRWDGTVEVGALDALGLPNLVPEIVDGTEVVGTLTAQTAAATGLPRSTPVFVGWNDLNASLVGLGAVEIGTAFDVGGTSEHIGAIHAEPRSDFDVVSVPDHGVSVVQHAIYGVTSNAGSVLAWLDKVSKGALDIESSIAATRPGSSGLVVLPYLHGERAPVWDAQASAAIVGLRASHDADDIVRAALEGIGYNLRAIVAQVGALQTGPIRSTGGTSTSAAWNRIKASILERPIATMRESDSASLGASMAAAVGAGAFASTTEAAGEMVRVASTIDPDDKAIPAYRDGYEVFIGLYPNLKHTLHQPSSKGQP